MWRGSLVGFKDQKKKKDKTIWIIQFEFSFEFCLIAVLLTEAKPSFLICKYLFYPSDIIDVKDKYTYIFDKLKCYKIVNLIIYDKIADESLPRVCRLCKWKLIANCPWHLNKSAGEQPNALQCPQNAMCAKRFAHKRHLMCPPLLLNFSPSLSVVGCESFSWEPSSSAVNQVISVAIRSNPCLCHTVWSVSVL